MRTLVFIAACVPLSLATLAASEPSGGFGFGGSAFSPPPASNFNDSRDRVEVSVVADRKQVAPGGDLVLAVIFDHQPTWHIHTEDPQVPPELGDPEDFKATYIAVTSSDGRLVPHDNWIQWPQPHEIDVAFTGKPVPYTVFSGRAIAWIPVTVPADATTGPAELVVRAAFQACDDRVCAAPTPQPPPPGEQPSQRWIDYGWSISINIVPLQSLTRAGTANETDFSGFNGGVFGQIRGGETSPDTSADDVTFDAFGLKFGLDTDATFGIVLLLLVAAVGGFLLNLTPCVLPVIPLKIMAISSSGGSRRRTLMLGVAMSAGVIGFWIGIGLAIALLTGFTASNQLFQYPIFTISIGIIIAVMAIGMCGLFSVRLPSAVYMVSPKHDTMSGSFLFGIMTAVLATPCTAPFMGAAMAWAATESPSVTLVTFAAIGIGMSLPYLFLAAFPKLTDRMPKAGPASELIKQVMGLLMLSAAAYFVGVGFSGLLADPPQPPSRIYLWYVAAIVVIAGLWLIIRTWQLTARGAPAKEMKQHTRTDMSLPRHALGWRASMTVLGSVVAAVGIMLAVTLTDHGPINWTWYTPAKFEEALADDKVVVLEFTAEWCLNCKALEESVLASDAVSSLLAEPDIAPIKIDLTGNNTEGNAMLHTVGRHQIPLLVVFAPNGEEVFKGDFYTVEQVVNAVNQARALQ
jgi:thiol:disulfide interchange protein DsbD